MLWVARQRDNKMKILVFGTGVSEPSAKKSLRDWCLFFIWGWLVDHTILKQRDLAAAVALGFGEILTRRGLDHEL